MTVSHGQTWPNVTASHVIVTLGTVTAAHRQQLTDDDKAAQDLRGLKICSK
jgi:hypothetical protein